MREARRQSADRLDHRRHAGAHLRDVVPLEVDLTLGLLQAAQCVGLVAQALPGGVARRLRDDRLRVGTERRQRRPVDQVVPELQVVEVVDVVVAEEVRVGDDHHATHAVAGRRQEPGLGRLRLVARAQHDRAGLVGDERPGAVETHPPHQVQQGRRAGAGRGLADDPGRAAAVAPVVEHGRVLDADAERRQQLVEVAAVLVLFGLAEYEEAAPARHERLDGPDLGVREDGRVVVDRALPLRFGGLGDHEYVGVAQHLVGQGSVGAGGYLEVALGEVPGRVRV